MMYCSVYDAALISSYIQCRVVVCAMYLFVCYGIHCEVLSTLYTYVHTISMLLYYEYYYKRMLCIFYAMYTAVVSMRYTAAYVSCHVVYRLFICGGVIK